MTDLTPDDWQVVEDALLVSSKRDPAFLALARLREQRSLQDVRICDLQDEIARLRERETQLLRVRDEWGNLHGEALARAEAAEARVAELEGRAWDRLAAKENKQLQTRVAEAEAIIHSALVTGSDPLKALREAMDALGGESIPVALAHREETP